MMIDDGQLNDKAAAVAFRLDDEDEDEDEDEDDEGSSFCNFRFEPRPLPSPLRSAMRFASASSAESIIAAILYYFVYICRVNGSYKYVELYQIDSRYIFIYAISSIAIPCSTNISS